MEKTKSATRQLPLIFMVALSVFTTDLYLCSFKELESYFLASKEQVQLSLGIYFIGMAFFTLFSSLLAHRFGEKKILVFSSITYLIGTALALTTSSIHPFILGRFLQSFGGASSSVLTRSLSAKKPKMLILMFVCVSTSVIVAPLLGGFLHTFFGWKANFFFMIFVGFFCLFTALSLPSRKDSLLPFSLSSIYEELSAPFLNKEYLLYTFLVSVGWMGFLSFVSSAPVFLLYHAECSPFTSSVFYTIGMLGFVLGSIISRKISNAFPLVVPTVFLSSLLLPFTQNHTELFAAVSFLFLSGIGLLLPYAQVQAVRSLTKTHYAFGIMYFIMMLFGTVPGLITNTLPNKESLSPFILSLLGACLLLSILAFWKKLRKNPLTT